MTTTEQSNLKELESKHRHYEYHEYHEHQHAQQIYDELQSLH
jgi:hypothetical protein